jgi:hypothetical protein
VAGVPYMRAHRDLARGRRDARACLPACAGVAWTGSASFPCVPGFRPLRSVAGSLGFIDGHHTRPAPPSAGNNKLRLFSRPPRPRPFFFFGLLLPRPAGNNDKSHAHAEAAAPPHTCHRVASCPSAVDSSALVGLWLPCTRAAAADCPARGIGLRAPSIPRAARRDVTAPQPQPQRETTTHAFSLPSPLWWWCTVHGFFSMMEISGGAPRSFAARGET